MPNATEVLRANPSRCVRTSRSTASGTASKRTNGATGSKRAKSRHFFESSARGGAPRAQSTLEGHQKCRGVFAESGGRRKVRGPAARKRRRVTAERERTCGRGRGGHHCGGRTPVGRRSMLGLHRIRPVQGHEHSGVTVTSVVALSSPGARSGHRSRGR